MEPIVTIPQGRLRGTVSGDVLQFRGIPFAAPPVGERRFLPPGPAPAWEGERDATRPGPSAVQVPDGLMAMLGGNAMEVSEDCLHLNVSTPGCDDAARPVMVWIHGGGFLRGSGSIPWYDGAALASRGDVVVVTLNYRLAALGFLWLGDLDATYRSSGVNGLLDQVAALEWVRDNIAAFGGDPDNVTIFGESGGGRKVLSLMASPEAAGLFHRAISQSGTLIPDTRSLVAAETIGSELQTNLGAASLTEMREKSWQDVVAAAATLVPYTNVDNHYLPYTERVAFESGNQNDVPFMFSINANDTPDPTNTAINVFPWMAPLCSANHYATYFTHQPAGWKAQGVEAYHAAELAYVFNMPESVITHHLLGLVIDPGTGDSLEIGDLNGNGVTGSQGDPADIFASAGFDATDQQVIDRMLTIWTNFAKTGDPSIDGEIDYPLYDAAVESYVEISATAEIKAGLGDALND